MALQNVQNPMSHFTIFGFLLDVLWRFDGCALHSQERTFGLLAEAIVFFSAARRFLLHADGPSEIFAEHAAVKISLGRGGLFAASGSDAASTAVPTSQNPDSRFGVCRVSYRCREICFGLEARRRPTSGRCMT